MGSDVNSEDIPVGHRLGTERLYDSGPKLVEPDPKPSRRHDAAEKRERGKPRPDTPTQPPAPTPIRPAAGQRKDVDRRELAGTLLELAGLVAITAGCAMIAIWLALIVGGVGLVVLGVATDFNVTK